MTGAVRRILGHFATLVPPGLVLLLLGIQVAFGLRGFDRPDDSLLLQVLQVPGILLGWGGVALLVPLLAWMIMDWWGYDLNGFALKGLGSAVLGIAFGALVGIGSGVAGGGLVGSGLANLLVGTLGSGFAIVLLLVMAGPAGVLALSMQRTPRPVDSGPADSGPADSGPADVGPAAEPAARPAQVPASTRARRFSLPRLRLPWPRRRRPAHIAEREGRAWYPQRRYDAEGNELPLLFGSDRDSGSIRFVEAPERESTDEPPAESVDEPAAAETDVEREDSERLPTIPELLSGQFDREKLVAEELLPEESGAEALDADAPAPREAIAAADDLPLHVDSEGRPTKPLLPTPPPRAPVPPQPALPSVPRGKPVRDAEPSLPPGVRWADDTAPDEEEPPADGTDAGATNGHPRGAEADTLDAAIASTHGLTRGVRDAVRGPGPQAGEAGVGPTIGSLRRSLRERFASIQTGETSERYIAKLEACGIFDDIGPAQPEPPPETPPETPPDAPPAGPTTRGATKTRATPKRKPAGKKATPKKRAAKKRAAKKKAAGRKVAAKKKSAPRKKATARRKPAKAPVDPERASRRRLLAGIRAERGDPLFVRAVEAALERGAATPVLYTRRLGLAFDRAQAMVDRLVDVGVLGGPSHTGAHPVELSEDDWASTAP